MYLGYKNDPDWFYVVYKTPARVVTPKKMVNKKVLFI